jgi:hypothetical protein
MEFKATQELRQAKIGLPKDDVFASIAPVKFHQQGVNVKECNANVIAAARRWKTRQHSVPLVVLHKFGSRMSN